MAQAHLVGGTKGSSDVGDTTTYDGGYESTVYDGRGGGASGLHGNRNIGAASSGGGGRWRNEFHSRISN